MMKSWCLRNAQICNKIDTLDSSFEITRANALLDLERVQLYIKKGVSLIFKRCGQRHFPGGALPPDPHHSLFLYIEWYFNACHDKGQHTLTSS